MSVLEIDGLRKSFGTQRAVQGVALRVAAGETVALLGPNGSGKTTVLRCVAGLLRPDAGRLRIDGRDVRRDPCAARERMAYVPQVATFPAQATVREVTLLHARLRGLAPARALAALASAGLEDQGRRMTGELSVGLRHRLALAVAQIGEPALMLLDEPTASLDPAAALGFRELVRGWRGAGRAVLLATHVLADAEQLADRVVVLIDGRVAADEPIAVLRERLQRRAVLRVAVDQPRHEHLLAAAAAGASEVKLNCRDVLITAPAERRFEILQRLAEVGPVRQLQTEEPSLESVYVELVKGGDHAAHG